MLKTKNVIIVLLVGAFCLGTAYCGDVAVREVAKKVDPYANTSILIEAFVVTVPMEALAEAGVHEIGQSPDGVSILKILWCLREAEMGEVVSGAKLMVGNSSRSESSSNETFYIKSAPPRKGTQFHQYSSGIVFSSSCAIKTDKSIRVHYDYSESGIDDAEEGDIPPSTFSYTWSGFLSLKSGEPVIAGAMQNDETATFFILTATIQDSDKTEK